MSRYDEPPAFSQQLHAWLDSSQNKTLADVIRLFEEKAFAIIFILLMVLPALPLPTGGVTHIFELVVALICLELIAGRQTIWLPARWLKLDVGGMFRGRAGQKFIRLIKWFERYSRRRVGWLLQRRVTRSVIGIIILTFTVAAFVAPPFSGLDTLPSLGVVVISLSLILEDMVLTLAGVLIGCFGIGLEIAAGAALYSGFTHFF